MMTNNNKGGAGAARKSSKARKPAAATKGKKGASVAKAKGDADVSDVAFQFPKSWLIVQPTHSQLAGALNVSRSTISGWNKNGAPVLLLPVLWVAWAFSNGKRCDESWGDWRAQIFQVLGLEDPRHASKGAQASVADDCKYDELVGLPQSWVDTTHRERAIGLSIENEGKRVENQIRRGRLFTPEQVAERERIFDLAVQDVLQEAPSILAKVKMPKPIREEIGKSIRDWQMRCNEALAAAARAMV